MSRASGQNWRRSAHRRLPARRPRSGRQKRGCGPRRAGFRSTSTVLNGSAAPNIRKRDPGFERAGDPAAEMQQKAGPEAGPALVDPARGRRATPRHRPRSARPSRGRGSGRSRSKGRKPRLLGRGETDRHQARRREAERQRQGDLPSPAAGRPAERGRVPYRRAWRGIRRSGRRSCWPPRSSPARRRWIKARAPSTQPPTGDSGKTSEPASRTRRRHTKAQAAPRAPARARRGP